MLGRWIIAPLVIVGTLLLAAPASAQAVCGERAKIVELLQTRHAESRRAVGLASNGTLLEIFASAAGTWTVLMTFPDGRTCMMADGEAWRLLEREAGGQTV